MEQPDQKQNDMTLHRKPNIEPKNLKLNKNLLRKAANYQNIKILGYLQG